jgi:beta-glucosidase
MSLEWSRLEPVEGHFSGEAFARYAARLARMRSLGLSPMVTLHHFTLPRWLAARGGFVWDSIAERFARYAARCASELGDAVDLWATINEPSVLMFMAYAGTEWRCSAATPPRPARSGGRRPRRRSASC